MERLLKALVSVSGEPRAVQVGDDGAKDDIEHPSMLYLRSCNHNEDKADEIFGRDNALAHMESDLAKSLSLIEVVLGLKSDHKMAIWEKFKVFQYYSGWDAFSIKERLGYFDEAFELLDKYFQLNCKERHLPLDEKLLKWEKDELIKDRWELLLSRPSYDETSSD